MLITFCKYLFRARYLDLELLYDLQIIGKDGLAGCKPPIAVGEGELPLCPKYPTYEMNKVYACDVGGT